jgi:hypothetical protein
MREWDEEKKKENVFYAFYLRVPKNSAYAYIA